MSAPARRDTLLLRAVELLSLCDLLPDQGIVRTICEGWHEMRDEALAEAAAIKEEV